MNKHTLNKTIITLIAFLSIASVTLTAASIAPSRKVTICQNNVKLSMVVSLIEEQTDFLFIVEKGVDLNSKVSLNVVDKDIVNVMKEITKGTNITFNIEGNYVMLTVIQAGSGNH